MIPNVFISSTISDLHFLRDAIRDLIEELGYRPVMSEYSEIGYINPISAVELCYISVQQCQLMILIIGLRYGFKPDSELSVTHQEYRKARDNRLPTITLVDQKVLAFKELFDSQPDSDVWKDIQGMDDPKRTFEFVSEVNSSSAYNAILPLGTVADVKRRLKSQIAHFVGDRLFNESQIGHSTVAEVLAEVKTIKSLMLDRSANVEDRNDFAKRYLEVARFLLRESSEQYRNLLTYLYDDLDTAIDAVSRCRTFDEIVVSSGRKTEITNSADLHKYMRPVQNSEIVGVFGHFGGDVEGSFVIASNDILYIDRPAQKYFTRCQKQIVRRLDDIASKEGTPLKHE